MPGSRRLVLLSVAVMAALVIPVFTVQTGAALPLRQREFHPSGAWCWFGDPRAIYYTGAHRRTYIGWVNGAGDIQVASYDHDTGERVVVAVKANFQIDDHANPSLLVRPDGHLMVFWSAHSGGTMYYRRTAQPEDVSSWEAERTVSTNTAGTWGYTYPNPVQLSAEGNRIWLFWRGGNFNPTFSTSADGLAWAPARTLISVPGQRPYVKVDSNGVDTIHLAFTQGHPRSLVTNIYYARYKGGSFYRANGSLIKSVSQLPFTPAQADKVYDAAAHGGVKAWIHDVAFDSTGRPVVVFATSPPAPTTATTMPAGTAPGGRTTSSPGPGGP
jgi:BNR repeat-containing family member